MESSSAELKAASVDRIFAASDTARHMLVFGKSKTHSPTLANVMETDALGLEPSQWIGIAERDELTAKL
jgi:hypothetical protein